MVATSSWFDVDANLLASSDFASLVENNLKKVTALFDLGKLLSTRTARLQKPEDRVTVHVVHVDVVLFVVPPSPPSADLTFLHSLCCLGEGSRPRVVNTTPLRSQNGFFLLLRDEEGEEDGDDSQPIRNEHSFFCDGSFPSLPVYVVRCDFSKRDGDLTFVPKEISSNVARAGQAATLAPFPPDSSLAWMNAFLGGGERGKGPVLEDVRVVPTLPPSKGGEAGRLVSSRLVNDSTRVRFDVEVTNDAQRVNAYAEDHPLDAEELQRVVPYLALAMMRAADADLPSAFVDELQLVERTVRSLYVSARFARRTAVATQILLHGVRLMSDPLVRGTSRPSKSLACSIPCLIYLATAVECTGDFASAASLYESVLLAAREVGDDDSQSLLSLKDKLAEFTGDAFARVGTRRSLLLAELHRTSSLRGPYCRTAWSSMARIYSLTGRKDQFVAVMYACANRRFRTEERTRAIHLAVESGSTEEVRKALERVSRDVPDKIAEALCRVRVYQSKEEILRHVRNADDKAIMRAERANAPQGGQPPLSERGGSRGGSTRREDDGEEADGGSSSSTSSSRRFPPRRTETGSVATEAKEAKEGRKKNDKKNDKKSDKTKKKREEKRVEKTEKKSALFLRDQFQRVVRIEAARDHAAELVERERRRVEEVRSRLEVVRLGREIGGC